MQKLDAYTPGGETPGGNSIEFKDISLTMRSRSESITRSKSGQANQRKIGDIPHDSLNNTS